MLFIFVDYQRLKNYRFALVNGLEFFALFKNGQIFYAFYFKCKTEAALRQQG